jgi:hypothetical protein
MLTYTGNVHHNIKIPMIGFYTGFHMDVSIVRGEICPHCNGTGAAQHAGMLAAAVSMLEVCVLLLAGVLAVAASDQPDVC